jgi:hypothetical protein
MDSLMTLELRNRLEASLGLKLQPTILWNYPSIAALAPFLATRMEISLDAEPGAHGETVEAAVAGAIPGQDPVRPLSDADMEASLEAELERVEARLGRKLR